ncbi:thermonuclease family protein [Tuwongella immobilis]|uniref:TNase-like domain-containing protein n=1 Tax=Tuwongella immobilis TaxID=692036 RepID=A0A6C2YP87_9BACT|nr:thermonuclease family protein [Tuwongella immobilis]VIP03214.1 thermonuclease : Thermonuclease OS=Bacillus megaterium (strain DSM 319) GN=BMD_2874 PE=4 SV=1: SNase [Tuwongella immobilis]VTS03730.1 thermonuclease : Thermonuclease OS=Bacillus megaterium (strain DSM 319) GN=BMD_2874 PE=4 SV=1: SNase [Tuwongella immobilis]
MNAMRVSLCLALFGMGTSAFAGEREFSAEVVKVHDGNSIRVRPQGTRQTIELRLIGVDAPRKATRDTTGQEPWGTAAQQFLSLAVTRKQVRIEFDVLETVSSDSTAKWAYVWLGERLLNEELLAAGHGVLVTNPPNVQYVDRLRVAQKVAREKQLGIWDANEPLTESPSAFRATQQQAVESQQSTQQQLAIPAWVEGCVIGNRKSKVFHKPGGRYYESTKMSANAIFFKTADDAIQAGYKPASR